MLVFKIMCGTLSILVDESKIETIELIKDFIAKHCTVQDNLFTTENQLLDSMRVYIRFHSKTPVRHCDVTTIKGAREMISHSTNGKVLFIGSTAVGIRLDTWPTS